MMLRRTFLRSLLLLPLLLGSVSAPGGEALPQRTLRVLFIGNSYTYGNDLPGLIKQLLPARGIKLEHESVTPGGATLEKQWADGKALAAIRKQKWDYVVLQEQSMRPFRDREAMFKAARLLHAEIVKTGAKTLLYETWAAKASPDEQPKLTDAYEMLGRELGATVVPAGEAWKKAIAAGFELHGSDGRHPNRRGSYLAACLFVATLTGETPVDLPNQGTTEGKLWTVAEAPALQRIAAETSVSAGPVAPGGKPELVFKTGFEGETKIVPYGESDNEMVGQDPSPPHKSDILANLGLGHLVLQYTGGDSSKRFTKIIPDPGNPQNQVLQFWLNDSWKASEGQVKARVQANLYGFKPGYKEFYQSVRVYLHADFNELRKYPQSIHWLTLAEFWNNNWWTRDKYPFRITLGVGKPGAEESELNFILGAESSYTHWLWRPNNVKVKVPIGQWFTLEYYYKQGDVKTGRFYVAMTPDGGSRRVVFDVAGWTQNPTDPSPDGMTDWNPMKLYTSKELVGFMKSQGKTLQIYWDDLELWKNRQPTDSEPTPAKP